MPSGYGNDTTASGDDSSSSGGVNYAQAIAQIFQTGVTAYTDSQAIQRGYQINDPRYFQGGYPAGVSNVYGATPAGASVAVGGTTGGQKTLILVIALVAAYLIVIKKL
jgi:hypothetical protein